MIFYAHKNEIIHVFSSLFMNNSIFNKQILIYLLDNVDLTLNKTKMSKNYGSK